MSLEGIPLKVLILLDDEFVVMLEVGILVFGGAVVELLAVIALYP
jgi:hypothetical protein